MRTTCGRSRNICCEERLKTERAREPPWAHRKEDEISIPRARGPTTPRRRNSSTLATFASPTGGSATQPPVPLVFLQRLWGNLDNYDPLVPLNTYSKIRRIASRSLFPFGIAEVARQAKSRPLTAAGLPP